ncbi:MAG: LysM peptidoglycan-binding domain-containing protein [Neisseriales bacterium]|nr:MAG: LysM peptidoglycan-binding domain-containing protein [Neisseriales bacterium]
MRSFQVAQFISIAYIALFSIAQADDTVLLPTQSDPLTQSAIQLNHTTLHDDNNLWQIIREGATLDEVNTELVRLHETEYAAQKAYLLRVFDRSRPFLFFITKELKERKMPMDIALLPIVESAYRAQATSSKGAAGLWQFMPATGQDYQLNQTWAFDARRDILQSTRAALDLLQNLYRQFKNWPLALAAYNWGPGNVSRAINKARRHGKQPTYENLSMPNETRHYVPRLLAIRNILLTSPKYGLKLEKLPAQPQLAILPLDQDIDVTVAAQLTDMPLSEFQALNASYRLPVLVADKNRTIVVLADRLNTFCNNLNHWGNKPLTSWKVYVPEKTVDVATLAKSFDMQPSELTKMNHLKDATVMAGKPLLVANVQQKSIAPEVPVTITAEQRSQAPVLVEVANTVSQEEVAVSSLDSHVMPAVNTVYQQTGSAPKQSMSSVPVTPALQTKEHVVVKGDTLSSIARHYRLSINHIKAINQLVTNTIKAGQILRIFPITSNLVSDVKQSFSKTSHYTTYTVKKGDTLYGIAHLFGVEMKDIKTPRNTEKLMPGQKLQIMR